MFLDLPSTRPAPTASLFSNHGLVLLCIAAEPGVRERDIAAVVGITERSAQRIVADLVNAGFIARRRSGRRNLYAVQLEATLSEPVVNGRAVGDLVALIPASQRERRSA